MLLDPAAAAGERVAEQREEALEFGLGPLLDGIAGFIGARRPPPAERLTCPDESLASSPSASERRSAGG